MRAPQPPLSPSGVQAPLWRALLAASGPTSIEELHTTTHADPISIQKRLAYWQRAGLVVRHDGKPPRYAMADAAAGASASKPPIVSAAGKVKARTIPAYERLWRAMRVLKSFDAPQLMLAAATSQSATAGYISRLLHAGYLRAVVRGDQRTGKLSVYRLTRSYGPAAPAVRKLAGGTRVELYDPNTRTSVALPAPRARRVDQVAPADGGVS